MLPLVRTHVPSAAYRNSLKICLPVPAGADAAAPAAEGRPSESRHGRDARLLCGLVAALLAAARGGLVAAAVPLPLVLHGRCGPQQRPLCAAL